MKLSRRNKKGFTLIEVVVVTLIIAILGSIVGVSIAAVIKNTEKKSATTALTNYWNLTSQAFNQINLGLSNTTTPTNTFLATRLGKQNGTVICTKNACTKLSTKGNIHVQYDENASSKFARYTIKRIVLNYNGKLYYTDDGKSIKGPRENFSD